MRLDSRLGELNYLQLSTAMCGRLGVCVCVCVCACVCVCGVC